MYIQDDDLSINVETHFVLLYKIRWTILIRRVPRSLGGPLLIKEGSTRE